MASRVSRRLACVLASNAATIAAIAVAVAPAGAHASITAVSGAATLLGSPPLSALPGSLIGPPAFCWNEQTNVTYSALAVNLTVNPGLYTGPAANFGVVAGTFDSHFIHFDASSGVANGTGSVTFSSSIVAVIYDGNLLDLTDGTLGSLGTTYDTGNPFRSYSGGVLNNSTIQLLGNTLNFDLWALAPSNFMSELRVLTHSVPTPGSLALIGLGGLMCARKRRPSA